MNNIVNDYAMFMQNLNLKNMMRKKARKYSKYSVALCVAPRIRQISISLLIQILF